MWRPGDASALPCAPWFPARPLLLLLPLLACHAERAPRPAAQADAAARPSVRSTPAWPLAAPSARPVGAPQPPGNAWYGQTGLSGLGLEEGAAGACNVRDAQDWYLRLHPFEPAKRHRKALIALRARLPGTLLCGTGGEIYLSLSTAQARELLGQHASLSGVRGAGNNSDTCGWYASLSPPQFVPQALARDVAELSFDTDPKFELINDFAPCAAP